MTKSEVDEFMREFIEAESYCDDLAQIWHEKGYSWPSGREIEPPILPDPLSRPVQDRA